MKHDMIGCYGQAVDLEDLFFFKATFFHKKYCRILDPENPVTLT